MLKLRCLTEEAKGRLVALDKLGDRRLHIRRNGFIRLRKLDVPNSWEAKRV